MQKETAKKHIAILLVLALLISLSVCAYFALKDMALITGGGQYKQAPNEEFTVQIFSQRNKNPLAKEKQVYGEITLRRGDRAGKVIKRITVYPISSDNEMVYRERFLQKSHFERKTHKFGNFLQNRVEII